MIGNFSQIFSRFHCVNKSNWCFSGVSDECQSLLHFLKPDQFAAVYGCTDPPLKKKMVIYASKSHSIWGKALPKIRLHFQLVTAFNIHIQTSGLRLCRHLPCYWHLPPVSLAHTMQIVVLHEFIFTGNDADLWSVFVHFACIFFFFLLWAT